MTHCKPIDCSDTASQGWTNFSFKGSDSKYFVFCKATYTYVAYSFFFWLFLLLLLLLFLTL